VNRPQALNCHTVRRLARILPNAFTVLWLLLFVAVGVLWVRSIGYDGSLGFERHSNSYWATSQLGYARLSYTRSYHGPDPRVAQGWCTWSSARSYPGHRIPGVLGFSVTAGHYVPVGSAPMAPPWKYGVRVTIPYWFLALLVVFWPVRKALIRRKRRRSSRRGLCPTCGYDLRATPERCPECGTIPADA
jgi:hypothetical protein